MDRKNIAKERTNNPPSWIIIGIFAVFLAFFITISVAKPSKDFSEEENRALQERPDVEWDAVIEGEFQKAYEDYLSDQFPGRGFFVSLKTGIRKMLGKRDINGVYFGDNGYLIEKYADSDFDEETVDDNEWYLSGFLADMADTFGEEHVLCMFVPSKGTVLRDNLPGTAVPYDTAYVQKGLKEYLEDEDVPADIVVDLTDVLQKHNTEYIYYRTDHHWTTLGAYYAYDRYREFYGQTAPEQDAYTRTVVSDSFSGTTYDKVQWKTKADEITRWELAEQGKVTVDFDDGEMIWDSFYDDDQLKGKDKYSYFLGGNTAKIHIATEVGNGRTLLLLKDSFSNSFVEFLARDYSDIYMIDLRYTNDNIYDLISDITEENQITDVLVMYNTEKFMKDTSQYQLEYLYDEEYEYDED